MALLDTEGFGWSANLPDYAAYAGYIVPNDGCSIQPNGPLGDNFLSLNNGGRYVLKPLPGLLTTFFIGCRVNFFNNTDPGPGLTFRDNNYGTLFSATHNPTTAAIDVMNDRNVTLGSTPAGSAGQAGWMYLEVGATIGGAGVGAVQVRLNGQPLLAATGVDTQSGQRGAAACVLFGNTFGRIAQMGVAHVYVGDPSGPAPWNNFLGDVRVQTLLPVADDAVQFSPMGQARNWQNAAQVPPNPGNDYNASSNVGDQDTFGLAPMAASLGAVFGVTTKALLSKSDAGNRSMASVLKSGGSAAQGTVAAVGTSPQQVRTVFVQDPATNAPWSQAGVSAAKAGYRIVS